MDDKIINYHESEDISFLLLQLVLVVSGRLLKSSDRLAFEKALLSFIELVLW
jgi:hypothetical protein